MKKLRLTLLSTALLFFAGTFTHAMAQSPVSFGLQGGMNISNLTGAEDDLDARFGLTAGAVLDISLPMMPFGIQSGVFYTQKGAKISDEDGDATFRFDYIEVPVMARFQLGPPGPITPHLVVGPYIGFNINSEVEGSFNGASVSIELDDETRSTEIGGTIGVGLDFNLGITKLNAMARYSYGFTTVFDSDFEDGERNAVLSVTVGIRF
jgi:hypothetical protein